MRSLSALLVALALVLAACGGEDSAGAPAGGATDAAAASEPLTVGATPVPHAEILQFIASDLAPDAGLELEVVEFTDYVQPNVALADGAIDANYFQTVPYLDEQEASRGFDFTPLDPVHIEPLGIYSEQVESLDAVEDGAVVAIPNDPTNAGRALELLEANGLITLADTGDAAPTALDVEDNPQNLEITEVEAAQLPRTLADTALSVINGNYALEAGLVPAEDAIALEEAEGNPNANLLVVRSGEQDDPRIQQLDELLHSEEVRRYIEENYEGAVIPAF